MHRKRSRRNWPEKTRNNVEDRQSGTHCNVLSPFAMTAVRAPDATTATAICNQIYEVSNTVVITLADYGGAPADGYLR
jgi:hypothetical protein